MRNEYICRWVLVGASLVLVLACGSEELKPLMANPPLADTQPEIVPYYRSFIPLAEITYETIDIDHRSGIDFCFLSGDGTDYNLSYYGRFYAAAFTAIVDTMECDEDGYRNYQELRLDFDREFLIVVGTISTGCEILTSVEVKSVFLDIDDRIQIEVGNRPERKLMAAPFRSACLAVVESHSQIIRVKATLRKEIFFWDIEPKEVESK